MSKFETDNKITDEEVLQILAQPLAKNAGKSKSKKKKKKPAKKAAAAKETKTTTTTTTATTSERVP